MTLPVGNEPMELTAQEVYEEALGLASQFPGVPGFADLAQAMARHNPLVSPLVKLEDNPMAAKQQWRIFEHQEGGMADYVACSPEDFTLHLGRPGLINRSAATEWAKSSRPGDQFEWGCGVIVDVTGGAVS